MNGNDRAITGLVMLAHGMVHTYELSLPILLGVWQAQFTSVSVPLAGTFAVTSFVMGLVLTAGYAPFGIGALPGGVLSDAYGSRPLIVACLVGMGGSFLALALAPSLLTIGLCLFAWGVSASVYHPAGLALISKGVSERGSAFAYHGIAGNLGIALGPLATVILLFVVGDWRIVVGALGVPAVVGAAVALRIDVDETAAVGTDGGEPTDARASGTVTSLSEFVANSKTLFSGLFALVFVVVMLSGLYYRGFLTFLPELLAEFPTLAPVEIVGREVSPNRYVYVGLLMIGVVGQYIGGKLTDRIPVEWGLVGGYGLLAVLALVFLPVATVGLGPLLAICGLMGIALFVVQPFYQATVAEYTPAGARGLSYGYTYLGVFGVGAFGGAVAGGLLTLFSGSFALFAALALFGGVASAVGYILARR